jgi:hypothetical protein
MRLAFVRTIAPVLPARTPFRLTASENAWGAPPESGETGLKTGDYSSPLMLFL